jgi:predicted nucleic acid-binding protein
MNPVFADTFYYLALLNMEDEAHERAVGLSGTLTAPIVTTAWVLTELANAYSGAAVKTAFLRLLRSLGNDPNCTIIPPSQPLFEKGLELFGQRLDKDWSLTDCISFLVMREHGITDALTGDHHLEQAGFRVLLK